MDQTKIGRFIAACRKKQNLTQMQLAEKLGITDRAVSKWETGKSMPDSSIMLQLCEILQITVNDLLTGEVVTMERYDKQVEENLLKMVEEKNRMDKMMLRMEIGVGAISMLFWFGLLGIACLVEMSNILRGCIIAGSTALFVAVAFWAIRIEQVAGYYVCGKCGHHHVPTYSATLFAMHVNRTRYLRCPQCGKYSWQKKVIGKE